MTAPAGKVEITQERRRWFAAYLREHLAGGVFHSQFDDGNWKSTVHESTLAGQPDDVIEHAHWFNTLTPSQRRRLRDRSEELMRDGERQ
jgi:hypothetical protein